MGSLSSAGANYIVARELLGLGLASGRAGRDLGVAGSPPCELPLPQASAGTRRALMGKRRKDRERETALKPA